MIKKILQIFLLTLISTTNTVFANPGMLAKLYCSIFGNTDARSEYQNMTYQALKDLGIKEPSDVPVKKMNGVGPTFARYDLSTFTAFGIWLDEDTLDTYSDEEKVFNIYHEASHYALKHHHKMLAGCGVAALLGTAGLVKINSLLQSCSSLTKDLAVLGSGLVMSFGCYRYLLPQIVKRQEKQADLLAAKILLSKGYKNVVEVHVKNLEKRSSNRETEDLWWHSEKNQASYLKELLQASSDDSNDFKDLKDSKNT